MQCNINAKGKAIRLVGGFLHLGAALVLAVLILVGVMSGPWWWAVAGVSLGGGLMVFEGWSGWCAMRAMGFKTPF